MMRNRLWHDTRWLSGGLLLVLLAAPALAHKVKVSEDVGGTSHIEPNDNPRAGESSLAWFALTRQGGQSIALDECRCTLAVYAHPRTPGDVPLLTPSLRAVSEEGYANIPGADIQFPKVGNYDLVLRGEPTLPDTFQPFELTFEVTVAQTAPALSPTPIPSSAAAAEQPSTAPSAAPWPTGRIIWAIALPLVVLVGGGLVWLRFNHSRQ